MERRAKDSRYQRSSRSRPDAKPELQFVNVEISGPENKAKTRSLVRANAAHFHWRHNRPPRDSDEAENLISRRAPARAPQKRSQTSRPHSKESHANPGHDRTDCCLSGTPEVGRAQLGVDVLDPFGSYVCALPSDLVSRCITFNAQMILPGYFPDGSDSSNIISNMLQLATSNAALLHLFMIGALLSLQGVPGIDVDNSLARYLFRCRAQIVRDISIAIRDPAEACKDVNIFAVSALAHKGRSRKSGVNLGRRPNQGPLKTLQRLDSYGLTITDPIHVAGLEKIIELKGGLEKIEMPGLAAMISSSGIRTATQDIVMPRYPPVTLSCPTEVFEFQYHESRLGFGFHTVEDLYKVMSMLKSYTIMISDHCTSRKVMSASVLIDHRNTTQHALLSLPPRAGNSECLRLAALIYSLLVTFPLPYTLTTFQCLVKGLRMALVEWDGDDQVLIWVLAMGGIGAVGLDERQWFVEEFREVTIRAGVRSWDEAREIIKEGLWFEATNGKDGFELWLESHCA